MKILLIHNQYLENGGEDAVVKAEAKLLAEHGHEVILYEKSNKSIRKLPVFKKFLFLFRNLSFSKAIYREIKEIIRKERPDIAHVHNIFIYITPSIYFALKDEKMPVVQSMHNYRFFCVKGTFFGKGMICEKCKNKKFFNAILRKCWRNSYFLSLLLARILYKSESFLKKIDTYIATSEFSRNKLIELGIDKEKISLKVNFLTIEPEKNSSDHNYALFLGRLVDYKGIETLIKAFEINPDFNLKIIGDGPMRNKVRNFSAARDNIEWLGTVSREIVLETIRKSSFVIFPSQCYENMPVVIMESFVFSKPVLASNLGAAKEFVIDGVNGVLFEPGNEKDLAEKISYLFSHNNERVEMGKNANRFYQERFSKEKNYRDLMDIYTKTINLKKN